MSNSINPRSFGADVFIVSATQTLLLFIGFIQTLILPKYLTTSDYGYFQLFLLYGGYIGLLHMGYIDGILVRWAGKDISIIKGEFKLALKVLIIEQMIVIIPLVLLSYLILNNEPRLTALMILVYAFIINHTFFFVYSAQALKQFKLSSVVNIIKSILFISIIIVIFILNYLNYVNTIVAILVSSFIALFTIVIAFRCYFLTNKEHPFSLYEFGVMNIRTGLFVMLGNFLGVILSTFDRLVVSTSYPLEQFAIYSFSITLSSIIYLFITSISQVLFPYISCSSRQTQRKVYRLAKSTIILTWAITLPLIYFAFDILIRYYLQKFMASIPLIQIMLCVICFSSLIQITHVTYFKLALKLKQYFLITLITLAFSIACNAIIIKMHATINSVAIVTLISFSLWYILNELSLRSIIGISYEEIGREFITIIIYYIMFITSIDITKQPIHQLIIYMIGFIILTEYSYSQLRVSIIEYITKRKLIHS